MRFIPALLGFAVLSAMPLPASAAAEKYILDKPHTQIMFRVNHLGFSYSVGKFLDYSGVIELDAAEPAKSKTDVTIQTASIDMGDDKWDEHLKGKDFFDVEKYPTMTFKSTGVKATGDKAGEITGDLTLHGVTKPVTLNVVQHNTGKHPMSNKLATGFTATTKIKRSDFGMSYGLPMVGDDVEITIEVEAYQEDKTAAGVENK